jgi:hypothetical protein
VYFWVKEIELTIFCCISNVLCWEKKGIKKYGQKQFFSPKGTFYSHFQVDKSLQGVISLLVYGSFLSYLVVFICGFLIIRYLRKNKAHMHNQKLQSQISFTLGIQVNRFKLIFILNYLLGNASVFDRRRSIHCSHNLVYCNRKSKFILHSIGSRLTFLDCVI